MSQHHDMMVYGGMAVKFTLVSLE